MKKYLKPIMLFATIFSLIACQGNKEVEVNEAQAKKIYESYQSRITKNEYPNALTATIETTESEDILVGGSTRTTFTTYNFLISYNFEKGYLHIKETSGEKLNSSGFESWMYFKDSNLFKVQSQIHGKDNATITYTQEEMDLKNANEYIKTHWGAASLGNYMMLDVVDSIEQRYDNFSGQSGFVANLNTATVSKTNKYLSSGNNNLTQKAEYSITAEQGQFTTESSYVEDAVKFTYNYDVEHKIDKNFFASCVVNTKGIGYDEENHPFYQYEHKEKADCKFVTEYNYPDLSKVEKGIK